ncbi:GGDEF domain-containing protein [Vibrio paucivorans]|uniref:Transporter substrate-binding domain-containing protein n=1 Tax=Vibrio paucivorans TaxID=2829489 RepID=A0A9X3CC57_9VIBR|nr:GGDEF domain-containing protein [Vibrio paucivorans]MCW8333021.1 transporter substrate-binding domain-containing protein [Vibrio paucivorans]
MFAWLARTFFFCCLCSASFALHAASSITTYKVSTEADDVVTRVLFDSIADEFNVNIDYIDQPSFDAILQSVESGDTDFAANITYTDARALRFSFSEPTNIEYTYLYSYNNARLGDISIVGVSAGTVYGELINVNFPHITTVEYSGHAEAYQLLNSGGVEGVVDAINQLKPMLLKGLDAQLLNDQISIQPVSIVAPKGQHQAVLKQMVAYIHTAPIQKLLRESIEKYQLDIRQQALRQAVIDAGLNISRPLKVKFENGGQYATYHRDGRVTGISADIVLSACEILLLKCDITSHAGESWESMYGDIISKDIDIIAPLVVSEHRKALVSYSDVYYQPSSVMVKREGYKDNVYRNVSELVVERIGVIEDDFFEELLGQLLPNKRLKTYQTDTELMQALLRGDIDYVPMSETSFNLILRGANELLPLVKDSMIGSFYTSDIAIGFTKNEQGEALAALFSRAMKMLDVESIVSQYDVQPDWRATLLTEKRFARQSQWLLMLVIGFMLVVAMYLHIQSTTDNLTRLKNRRALHRKFRTGVGANMTLVYLDINEFKVINDNYGHEIGDEVLKALADRIRSVWRGSCYRIGGDEFVLVADIERKDIIGLSELLSPIYYRNTSANLTLKVSVAVGVSPPRKQFMSLQEVMNIADEAMYRDKNKETQCASKTSNILRAL